MRFKPRPSLNGDYLVVSWRTGFLGLGEKGTRVYRAQCLPVNGTFEVQMGPNYDQMNASGSFTYMDQHATLSAMKADLLMHGAPRVTILDLNKIAEYLNGI